MQHCLHKCHTANCIIESLSMPSLQRPYILAGYCTSEFHPWQGCTLENSATSWISQGKPNSVTLLSDVNSMRILEASNWAVLYTIYHFEICNCVRSHFDLLITSSYAAFQTEYQSSDRNKQVWFLLSYVSLLGLWRRLLYILALFLILQSKFKSSHKNICSTSKH